jgi:divalent metal cation (Fe/Co/Zn/Cd) transporter
VTLSIASQLEPTPQQVAQERSVLLAVGIDSVVTVLLFAVGILGGSLTITAEAIRATLTLLIESFSLVVMRRINRGAVREMEFGSGKLEQLANACLGIGMLLAAAWLLHGAIAIVAGDQDVGTPFGLASAAIIGIVNLYCNLIAWDAVRRAAALEPSLIMLVQLRVRVVKLLASGIVGVTLTVAALATDDLIVAWADAIGSLFVAAYMTVSGYRILRAAIPDIVDQAAGREATEIVERCLGRHAEDYVMVERVRSRLSGRVTFIEIVLAYDVELTMAEVDRRIRALKAAVHDEIAHADVSVIASSVPHGQLG